MDSNLQYAGAVHPLRQPVELFRNRKFANFQFRDAPPRARAPSFGGEWAPRAAETSLLILPRPTLLGSYRRADSRSVQNSDEASKPLPVSCGTESSNPFPSSGESHKLFLRPASACLVPRLLKWRSMRGAAFGFELLFGTVTIHGC